MGGVSTKVDIGHIKNEGANILIATPGKLTELLETKEIEEHLVLKNLEILIMGNQQKKKEFRKVKFLIKMIIF